ncbi:MAG TPA: hypothetical protein VFD52_02230 [Clostridia bacterium]|nr:hypothetical protein [Clostridia bacterium]
MKKRSEFFRILRSYILTITASLCILGLCCGVIIAGNNTKALSEGERAATVSVQTDEKVSLIIDKSERSFEVPPIDKLYNLAACAPAPYGNLVFVVKSIYFLADSLM